VCVSFQFLSFKLSSGCLFSPHHVNQGSIQKSTPQVTLYESHTAEESLRRHRSGRNSQMLPGHPVQARELLHVLLPPHERVCVKGHLLHSRVGINHPSSLPHPHTPHTHPQNYPPHRRRLHLPLPRPCRHPCSSRVVSGYSSHSECFSCQSLITVALTF
jgi:hypothetical protein